MKKVIIFGASGRVGLRVIEYALNELYEVTAFVRDREKFKIENSKLKIFTGDVLNSKEVENAMEGQNNVISCLSGRKTKPDYSVLTTGIQNIILGMEKHKLKRILNVAGAGILDDKTHGLRRNRPNYPEIFKRVSAENWKVYEIFQNTSLDWTMVCAPEMPEGEKTGEYRYLPDFLPEGGSRISVGDVADFILKNLENKEVYEKRVGIAY